MNSTKVIIGIIPVLCLLLCSVASARDKIEVGPLGEWYKSQDSVANDEDTPVARRLEFFQQLSVTLKGKRETDKAILVDIWVICLRFGRWEEKLELGRLISDLIRVCDMLVRLSEEQERKKGKGNLAKMIGWTIRRVEISRDYTRDILRAIIAQKKILELSKPMIEAERKGEFESAKKLYLEILEVRKEFIEAVNLGNVTDTQKLTLLKRNIRFLGNVVKEAEARGDKSEVKRLSKKLIALREEYELALYHSTKADTATSKSPVNSAVYALIKLLGDEDPEVRGSAAFALETIGPEADAAIPVLIRTLEDEDKYVLWTAIGALGKIGPAAHTAVPAILDTLKRKETSDNNVVRALGGIGEAAIPYLIKRINSPDANERVCIARALRHIYVLKNKNKEKEAVRTKSELERIDKRIESLTAEYKKLQEEYQRSRK